MEDFRSTITKEEVAALPQEKYSGKITIISTVQELNKALTSLAKESFIGFDTETRPSFSQGVLHQVALMQLATEKHCFLLRLNKIGLPDALVKFIGNPDIKKIGLSLKDDFHVLRRRYDFKPAGFIDLQNIMQNYGIEELSLQKSYAIIFNKKISKSQRLTNWEAEKLTRLQQEYAALDAWACLNIYKELRKIPTIFVI